MKKLMLLVASLFVLLGCDSNASLRAEAVVESKYPIIDSGRHVGKELFWLDDHRVIFHGYLGDKPRSVEESKKKEFWISIWDTRTGEFTKVSESTGGLCYRDGHIYYMVSREAIEKHPDIVFKYVYRIGQFGNEQESTEVVNETQRRKEKKITNSEWDDLNCKGIERPASMEGRYWVPLLEGDGYLDKGPSNAITANPVVHHKDGNMKDTGLLSPEIGIVEYIDFRDKYFTQGLGWGEKWKESGCVEVRWIDKDGNSERVCVSMKWWLDSGHKSSGASILPTKVGYFVPMGLSQDGTWGGHLITGSVHEHVINGDILSKAVSPDGCKVAMSHAYKKHASRIGSDGQFTLKVVDLCQKK